MSVSKAQIRATTKYESKVYDKVLLRLSKGEKEKIKAHAESLGMSLNAFIVEAIEEKMKRAGE